MLGCPGGHAAGAVGVCGPDGDAVGEPDACEGGVVLPGGEVACKSGRFFNGGAQFAADDFAGGVFGGHEVEDSAGVAVDAPGHAVDHGVGFAGLLDAAEPDFADVGQAEGVHDLDGVRGVFVPPGAFVGAVGDDAVLLCPVADFDFLRVAHSQADGARKVKGDGAAGEVSGEAIQQGDGMFDQGGVQSQRPFATEDTEDSEETQSGVISITNPTLK